MYEISGGLIQTADGANRKEEGGANGLALRRVRLCGR
jgi:hypothetical protein